MSDDFGEYNAAIAKAQADKMDALIQQARGVKKIADEIKDRTNAEESTIRHLYEIEALVRSTTQMLEDIIPCIGSFEIGVDDGGKRLTYKAPSVDGVIALIRAHG